MNVFNWIGDLVVGEELAGLFVLDVCSTVSYRVAFGAREKHEEWQLALGLLRRMTHAKVEADSIRYNATISAGEKNAKSGYSQ